MALTGPALTTAAPLQEAVPFRHPGADRGGQVELAGRRILVVRPDNVGDVVLLTPALRALRAAAPDARIELLASPAGAAVAPMIPELDGVLTASPSWQLLDAPANPTGAGALAAGEHDLLGRIAAGRYDVLLVFTSFSQSPWPVALLGLLAGVPTRVVHSREFAGAVATHWVTPPPDTAHHVDRSLHLLWAIGVPDRGPHLALRVPRTAYAEADRLLDVALSDPGPVSETLHPADQDTTARYAGARRPQRFALLVPGASCPSRRYPAHRFGAAAAAVADTGLPVLVSGTAGETDLVTEVVRRAGSPAVRALPATELRVFAALVARAAVALTNNSGGLHIADAVGTPVAATYAGTERLGDVAPRSVPCELLQVPVGCSPCRQLTCPFHHECLDVAPARLASAALRLASPDPARELPDDLPKEHRWPHGPNRARTA
jgi:ADP-heptose:LPS heptosyltransferase